jgi:hypothetical protein
MEIIVFQGLLFFLYSVLLSWNAFIVRVGFAGHGQSLAIRHIQVWSTMFGPMETLMTESFFILRMICPEQPAGGTMPGAYPKGKQLKGAPQHSA